MNMAIEIYQNWGFIFTMVSAVSVQVTERVENAVLPKRQNISLF